jgi:hypothetical protein
MTALKDRLSELMKTGYAVNVPKTRLAEYIPTHEFAHTLLATNSPLSASRNFVGVDLKKLNAARREITELFEEYKKAIIPLEADFKKKELAVILGDGTLAEAQAANKAFKAARISAYSLENADEFLAESFVSVKIGNNDNAYAQQAVAIIDRYFKR